MICHHVDTHAVLCAALRLGWGDRTRMLLRGPQIATQRVTGALVVLRVAALLDETHEVVGTTLIRWGCSAVQLECNGPFIIIRGE